MQKPHAIPVFITISFLLGIVIGIYSPLELSAVYWISGGIFIGFIAAFIRAKRLFFQDWVFGASAFLVFIVLGVLTAQWQQPAHNAQHYIHQDLSEAVYLQLKIRQKLNPNPYNYNYSAEVKRFNQTSVDGKVLLSIRKDSLSQPLYIDDQIALKTKLKDIYEPLNPFQFNYAAYMAHKGIFKEVRTVSGGFVILAPSQSSLLGIAAKLRRQIEKDLAQTNFSPNQVGLIDALLLGQRTTLSEESYTNFIEAGVVHVLAVSGLHIGILLYFLMFLFKPLIYLPRGNIIRTCIVILLLWAYALLVGMSPSILRAVTMFSFLSFGLFFKRQRFTINLLCLSAIVLLLYNPYFILDVGFQLSYCAVLAILLFQNKIFKLFSLKHKVGRYIWRITSVTLAAQLGVLPLSLYYFHQFPGLFLLSNLLIVPFTGLILSLGVFVLVLVSLDMLPAILVTVYGGILDLLQAMVDWVASKDAFIFQHIYFSPQMLVLSITVIVLLAFVLHKQTKRYVYLFLVAIIMLQLGYIYEYKTMAQKHVFYVFHKSRHSIFGFQNGHRLKLFTDNSLNKDAVLSLSFLKRFQSAQSIRKLQVGSPIKNYYVLGGHKLLVIDSTGIWQLPQTVEITEILLRNSPEINLDIVLNCLSLDRVIADGSNYKSMVARWRKTCQKRKVPFHYTGKDGAFYIAY